MAQACHLGRLVHDEAHDAEVYEVGIDRDKVHHCDRLYVLVAVQNVIVDAEFYADPERASGPYEDAKYLNEDKKAI